MNKIIILVLSLVLISCEKKDYVEEVQWRDYISKSEYKDGKLIKLKNFKNGILHTEFFYKDGRIIDKGIEYYPNKKILLTYSLIEKNVINKKKVEFTHTIFGECEEYPKWSCKFDEYKKVLYGWDKFLKMPESLETKLEIEL